MDDVLCCDHDGAPLPGRALGRGSAHVRNDEPRPILRKQATQVIADAAHALYGNLQILQIRPAEAEFHGRL